MLAYRIEGIIGESLCKDENDRNAVAEMKHKYANRSEVFNNRFGKNAYIFIADTSEEIITLGAFVTDLQKISAIVDSYAQHMGIQMTDIVISEVTLKKLYGLLSKAESQNFIQDTNEILAVGEEARLMLGRTPANIIAVRPLRDGVISDYDITERMLKHFIKKSCGAADFLSREL